MGINVMVFAQAFLSVRFATSQVLNGFHYCFKCPIYVVLQIITPLDVVRYFVIQGGFACSELGGFVLNQGGNNPQKVGIGDFCSDCDNLIENKKEPLVLVYTKGFQNIVCYFMILSRSFLLMTDFKFLQIRACPQLPQYF